jgi:hypothetical protein
LRKKGAESLQALIWHASNQLEQVQHAEVENDEDRHADSDGQVFTALEEFLEAHLNDSVRVIE